MLHSDDICIFNFFILSKIQNTGYFYSLWQAFIPSCKGLGLCPLLCPWLPLANQVRRTFTVILVTVIVIAIFIGIIIIMISWYQHCRNHQRSENQGSYPQNYDHHLHNNLFLSILSGLQRSRLCLTPSLAACVFCCCLLCFRKMTCTRLLQAAALPLRGLFCVLRPQSSECSEPLCTLWSIVCSEPLSRSYNQPLRWEHFHLANSTPIII